MFGSKPKTPAEPSGSSASTANSKAELSSVDSSIVIHTMPREFYGIASEPSQTSSEPTKAQLLSQTNKPAELAPPPVIAEPAPSSISAPAPAHLPAKRSWKGPLIAFIIMLAVLGAGGFAAYRIVDSAKQQKQLAEAALSKLKDQEAQQAADAAAKAAQDAAAAAALAAVPVPAKDTDSDGLTDIEELLYGTNFREPDTDKDSFLDGNEVFHGYDPLGLAPLTLLDTGAVKVYSSTASPFTIYYPTTWTPAVEGGSTIFRSSRQASIIVTDVTKDASLSLADWYNAQTAGNDAKQLKETLTKEGYYGLTSADDRTTYLDGTNNVVTLAYDLGARSQIEYLQTFEMMVNSFHFTSKP